MPKSKKLKTLFIHAHNRNSMPFIIQTDLSESDLRSKLHKIKELFYASGFEDWDFGDIMAEAVKKKFIKHYHGIVNIDICI